MYVCMCVFHRTFLKDCPFVIKVRVTKDGQKLYVKEISGEHNHELSEVKTIIIILFMYSIFSCVFPVSSMAYVGSILPYAETKASKAIKTRGSKATHTQS